MQPSIRFAFLSLCIVSLSRATTGVLVNSDFESPSILGVGQTDAPVGGVKALVQDAALPGYVEGILGIPFWQNSFTDVGFGAGTRDAGISRADFAGSGETRYAFINNWDTRLSQVTAMYIEPGYDLFFTTDVGAPGMGKGGKFQLWAGEPLPANPDLFPTTAVMLGETTFGSADWTGFTPDVHLVDGQWTNVSLHIRSPLTGPAIGQPLTISFLTSDGSLGPVYYDNVRFNITPEPGALFLLPAICAIVRRRR